MYARLLMPIALSLSLSLPVAAQTNGGRGPNCRETGPEPERDPRPAQTARHASQAARRALILAMRDSIRTEVNEAARAAGIDAPVGIVIIELRDRRTGEAQVSLFGSNIPDAVAAQAVERRAALLARMPRDETLLNVRLDPRPSGDTGVECLPELLDARTLVRRLEAAGAEMAPASSESAARFSMRLRMLVTRDGEVAYATLSRRSARGDVDRAVLEVAQDLRFRPAQVGGVPVDVWVEQPVELHVPVRERAGRRP